MRPREIKQLIEIGVKDPVGTPPVMEWGAPGIGKSALPKEVAQEQGVGFIDIRGPQLDPSDLRGIPTVVGDKAKWLAPTFLPSEGRGILFLDELVSAPPLVQASMYQLVLDRAIGEYCLPNGWYIIAAGNRQEDRAVSYRMPTALANRFTHINFEVNLEDWMQWAMAHAINPNIIAFLRFKPDMLWAFKPESSEHAFPTPRTWAFADRLIKRVPSSILPQVLEGTIGKGAQAEFVAFLKVQTELPPLDDIFNGKNFWPEKRMDLKYALIAALATHAKGEKQFERMVQYSEKVDEEFGVLLVTMLAVKDDATMGKAPSFPKWCRRHSDVLIPRRKI